MKSYKLKNDNYIDSSSIVHNKENLKDILNKHDYRIEYGTETGIDVPATGYASVTVNFKKEFKQQPHVIVTAKGNYNLIAQVSGTQKGSAIVNLRSADNTARTGRQFSWIAIGI